MLEKVSSAYLESMKSPSRPSINETEIVKKIHDK